MPPAVAPPLPPPVAPPHPPEEPSEKKAKHHHDSDIVVDTMPPQAVMPPAPSTASPVLAVAQQELAAAKKSSGAAFNSTVNPTSTVHFNEYDEEKESNQDCRASAQAPKPAGVSILNHESLTRCGACMGTFLIHISESRSLLVNVT